MSILYGQPKSYLTTSFSNNSYIDTFNPNLDTFTIEIEVYVNSILSSNSYYNTVFMSDTQASGDLRLRFFGFENFTPSLNFDNGTNNVNLETSFDVGQWVTYSFVADKNNGVYLYKNGVLEDSASFTWSSLNWGNLIRIGRTPDFYLSGKPNSSNMSFREFRIWDNAQSQSQIQSNLNATLTGNESNLFTFYNFQEGSGNTLNDIAGNNDGTIVGATWEMETVSPAIQNIYHGTETISKIYAGQSIVYEILPPALISNLQVWYDATKENNYTNNQNVNVLTDLSGNNYNSINNGSNSTQPTYISNGINNKPSIVFDGSNDFLFTNTPQFNQPITFFMVMNVTKTNESTFFSDDNVQFEFWYTGTTTRLSAGNSVEIGFKFSGNQIYTCIVNGGSSLIRRNGSNFVSGNAGGNNLQNFNLGKRYTNQLFGGFQLGEFILYNKRLSSSEYEQIENYLSEKWNI